MLERAAVIAAALVLAVPDPADAAQRHVLFRFEDPSIVESSALVDGDGVVYTINDAPDSARVFVVAKGTGRTVGVTTYSSSRPFDVEALAAGPHDTMWVGDIGDNSSQRSHITVYRIPTPARGDRSVRATAFDLVYGDGPRDAEALLVQPRTGRLYVVSKGLLGGTVYAAPVRLRPDRTNVLRPVGSAPGLVTDGVFLPDGRHVLLRDYWEASVLRAGTFARVARFALPRQEQGEGVGIAGSRVLTSSEGVHAPVKGSKLPARFVADIKAPTPRSPAASPTVDPAPRPRPETSDGGPWDGTAGPLALAGGWLLVAAGAVVVVHRRRRGV